MDAHIPMIGILSIGEMGFGIAHLLISHGYRVATFAEDRRQVFIQLSDKEKQT